MEGRRTLLRAAAVIARLMVCLLIILAMVRIGRYAYSVGYQVFGQRQGQAEEPGETLTVDITEGMGTEEIGSLLKEKGLVDDVLVFRIQKLLSGDGGAIQPGTYVLNTAMSAEQILDTLKAGAGDEGGDSP